MKYSAHYVKRDANFGDRNSVSTLDEVPIVAKKQAVTLGGVLQSPAISIQKMKNAAQGSDAEEMLKNTRAIANENMSGRFFNGASGEDKISVRHLENSESVITKAAPEGKIGNAYVNIRQQSATGNYSVIAAASQAPNKYPKDTKKTRLRDEAAMHVAQAIFAHRLQFELNNRSAVDISASDMFSKSASLSSQQPSQYQGPSIIVVNNYMTDQIFLDKNSVTDRKDMLKKITQELANAGPEGAQFQEKVGKYLAQMSKDAGLSLDEMAAGEIAKKAVTSKTLLFQQQGVNAVRSLGASSDASFLGSFTIFKLLGYGNDLTISEAAQKKSKELLQQGNNSQSAQLDNLVAEYEKTRQAIASNKVSNIIKTIGAAINDFFTNKGKGLGECKDDNLELHKEALKLVMISKMDGASVSGCMSAKDRMAIILAMARAQENYMVQNSGTVAQPNDPSFQKMFAKEWLSGQLQYVCEVNAPGAGAVKNPTQIIPPEFREAIKNEVAEKFKEAARLPSPEREKKQDQLIMFLPEVSHVISNLNKYAEKGEKVVKKITNAADKYLEEIQTKIAAEVAPQRVIAQANPSLGAQTTEVTPPPTTTSGLASRSTAALPECVNNGNSPGVCKKKI